MHITQNYSFEFDSQLPEHVGLGSQTQLSLAVAQGLSILEGHERSTYELATLAERGGTSGIGVAAYTQGGFILDGGHSRHKKTEFLPSRYSNAEPAVLVNRVLVPEDWCFVVAIPDVGQGKSGPDEAEIFEKYCPIPSKDVEKLTRVILMQILPAIVENDIDHFGEGLNTIQQLGFKRIENQLQHAFVKDLQNFFLDHGAVGTGLSSFGPATFAVLRSKIKAQALVKETEQYLKTRGHSGTVFFTQADNTGAKVETF
jgi:beta-ribofuranosylaminobenzene 5'-phosphate synthase